MRLKADSTTLGYGISVGTNGYLVYLPKVKSGSFSNTFKSLDKCRNWQLTLARKEWGIDRFQIIKRGRLCTLRSTDCGVAVRPVKSTMRLIDGTNAEYWQYGVFWREHDGSKKSKFFSHKKFGEFAEIEANWFACFQRAKLTASEINIPLNPLSFDISASVQIKQG